MCHKKQVKMISQRCTTKNFKIPVWSYTCYQCEKEERMDDAKLKAKAMNEMCEPWLKRYSVKSKVMVVANETLEPCTQTNLSIVQFEVYLKVVVEGIVNPPQEEELWALRIPGRVVVIPTQSGIMLI